MILPEQFIEEKFFSLVGFPEKYNGGNMKGCCPFCMEGKSWGKDKRLHYYFDNQIIVCYNCGSSFNPISFIKSAEGVTFKEIMAMLDDEDVLYQKIKKKHVILEDEGDSKSIEYPKEYINLSDVNQKNFYKGDYYFSRIDTEIARRRLNTAVNKGELWCSFTDFLHKNRIIIPFYDESGELVFYQSRAMTDKQSNEQGKYISCLNGSKTFWGLDKIDIMSDNIFLFEGPLDCFFVKNSFGGGGTKLNDNQKTILDTLKIMHNIVICLDNDFDNKEVFELYEKYIADGYDVFMWGGEFDKCKDINQYCVDNKVDEVKGQDIMKYVYSGELAVKELNKKRTLAKCPSISYDEQLI